MFVKRVIVLSVWILLDINSDKCPFEVNRKATIRPRQLDNGIVVWDESPREANCQRSFCKVSYGAF